MRFSMPGVLILLSLAICISGTAPANGAPCSKEGDPGFYVDFGVSTQDVIPGETVLFTVAPTNFGFVSGSCPNPDTFCVDLTETADWLDEADPPLGNCYLLNPGYLWWQDIQIYVPCEAVICDYDTLIISVHYCNADGSCDTVCSDLPGCEDPNWYNGDPYYSADTMILHVVEAPPSLYILQDSIYLVDYRQTHAYVPFSICNGDPCSQPTEYSYIITNRGHVPGNPAFPQEGSITVEGGECDEVYAIVDGTGADPKGYDTLMIVAWDTETGSTYDTCVQDLLIIRGP